MSKLQIGQDGFSLKAETFEDVVAILGRRGRGKTTTATVIVEGLHAAGARFVVVDPVGVWYGLKSSRDGRRPGIPVVVMGGDHGDVPLAHESGEIIADFVADPTSPSVVLDLKLFTQGEMVRFMTAFLSRLYHVNPGKPLHVVLDEADQFAPQRPMKDELAMLGAAQRVTKMGRSKGLHPILITQRPATLSKNVLTQAGLLISHAITGPQDRDAVDDWIKANAEEGERETFLAELSGLPRGTAYFWSPDIPLFRQVAVRDRETFNSSATPKRGEAVKPKALAEVDLEALKGRIAATIEKAKAEDPRELRRRIAELEREVRAAKAAQPPAPKAAAPKRVEIEVVKPRQVNRLAAVARILGRRVAATEEAARVVRSTWQELDAALKRARALSGDPIVVRAVPGAPGRGVSGVGPGPRSLTSASPVVPAALVRGNGRAAAPAEGLTGPEQRILDALAWLEGVGQREARQQAVAFLAGYTVGGGAFNNPRSALRVRGLIEYHGDRLALTEVGRVLARAPGAALTPEELQARVLGQLPGPEGKLLRVLLDAYPGALSNEDLAQRAGYAPNGGAYNNPRGRLRSLGLIDYQGGLVVARPVLFLQE